MIDKAFKRTQVYTDPSSDNKLIEWVLWADYEPESVDLLFYIDVRRATGNWTRLNPSTPVVNNCFFWDTTPYRFNMRADIYYRVVLKDGSRTFTSCETNILGGWNDREWLIIRDIVRKEYLRLSKYAAGSSGWLLKRKTWGVKCTACQEFDSQTSIRPDCPICYGTTIVGGYYDAVSYYIEFLPAKVDDADVQFPVGTVSDQLYQTRSIAFPILDSKDIWVDANNNDRYIVGLVKETAELKGIAIMYENTMAALAPLAPEYNIPLSQGGGGSSSSE